MANPPSKLRGLLIGLALAVVAAGGLWFGRLTAARPDRVLPQHAPEPGFKAGDAFPTVPVLDEDGVAHTTTDLMGRRGAVVLFLDFECSPCATMTARWNEHLATDSLRGVPVIGVTHFGPAAIRDYRRDHAVTFPIYSDTANAFVRRYGVNDMPLCLAVDRARRVRWSTFDPEAPIPAGPLEEWVRE